MRARPWVRPTVDAVLVVIVASLLLLSVIESGDYAPRPFGALSVVTVLMVALWSGLARRWPRASLVGVSVCISLAFALVVPAFEMVIALAVPVFAVGRAGRLGWGTALLAALATNTFVYRIVGEPGSASTGQVLLDTLQDTALLGVVLLLGETIRSRRAVREEAQLKLTVAEQDHQRRLTEQRLRTAHDLHDVLAHTLTVINIQASVANESLGNDRDRARSALDRVTAASREALADLRGTIEVLRADSLTTTEDEPAPGVDQIPGLLDVVRATGVEVSLEVDDGLDSLRPAISLAVYRVVQESLTNVLRHSDATAVRITIRCTTADVRLEVCDDGRVTPGENLGFGVRGMNERIGALGGQLSSGPVEGEGGGYVVRARLPTGG